MAAILVMSGREATRSLEDPPTQRQKTQEYAEMSHIAPDDAERDFLTRNDSFKWRQLSQF